MPILDIPREPQKAFNWEIEVFSRRNTDVTGAVLKYYAKNVSIPMESVESVKRYYASKKYHVPMRDSSPNIFMVSFWDNQDLDVYLFFKRLKDLINSTNKESTISGGLSTTTQVFGATPNDYLFDIQVTLQTNLHTTNTVHTFKDCHVMEIGEMPLNYSDSSEVTFDVRFGFDDSEIKVSTGFF